MFEGRTDPDRYLSRVLDEFEDPADYEYLVYGVGRRPHGGLYPVPCIVTGGPERALERVRAYDMVRPETHMAAPIFRVDYIGRP